MKKQILFIVFLCFAVSYSKAQNIAYYPLNSVFAISTNTQNNFFVDFRFQTNTFFQSLTTDIAPQFNIVHRPRADYFLGGGIQINFINLISGTDSRKIQGYFLDAGVRVSPIDKIKNAQIIFALSPIYYEQDLGQFRARIGLSYNFDLPR